MNGDAHDPRSALSRPRRLAVALGLFLLLAVIPVTIAGVSQEEAAASLPETFQTTAPHDEDQGVYTVTVYERAGKELRVVQDTEDAFRFMHRFHWLPLEAKWTQVHEVREFREYGCSLNDQFVVGYTSDLYDSKGRSIGYGKGCDHADNPVVSDAPGWGERVISQSQEELTIYKPGELNVTHAQFCGHKHIFQQKPVVLDDLNDLDGVITGYCGQASWLSYAEDFDAIAMVDAGPEDALVVEGTLDPDGVTTLQLWFVPSLPYPVRVSLDDGDGHITVHDLDRFQRGQAPAPHPGAAVDLERKPWGFSGPAEGGVDHPFPLSAALQVAEEDPEYDDYRDYVESHPDAVVQSADYRYHEDSSKKHEWAIVLSEGGEEYWAPWIEKTVERATPEFLEHHTGVQGPEKEPDYEYSENTIISSPWWDPDDLPHVPTVASLFALYESLTGREANQWGVEKCYNGCDGEPYVTVGRTVQRESSQWQEGDVYFASGVEKHRFEDRLILAADGSLVGWEQKESQDRYGPNVTSEPKEPSSLNRDVSAMTIDTVVVWRLPVAVAAGSVFTALAVAVGYWLWPLAKIGPTMLFSRVQRDKLLKNPNRQTIHQMIETRPGIHYKQLVRALGQPDGTVKHHLDKLVQGGLVTTAPGAGYTCYFIAGEADRHTRDASSCLKSPVAQGLMQTIQERPGITGKQAAERLGVTPATVHYHLKRMDEAGLLIREREGGGMGLKLTSAGEQVRGTSRRASS